MRPVALALALAACDGSASVTVPGLTMHARSIACNPNRTTDALGRTYIDGVVPPNGTLVRVALCTESGLCVPSTDWREEADGRISVVCVEGGTDVELAWLEP